LPGLLLAPRAAIAPAFCLHAHLRGYSAWFAALD